MNWDELGSSYIPQGLYIYIYRIYLDIYILCINIINIINISISTSSNCMYINSSFMRLQFHQLQLQIGSANRGEDIYQLNMLLLDGGCIDPHDLHGL